MKATAEPRRARVERTTGTPTRTPGTRVVTGGQASGVHQERTATGGMAIGVATATGAENLQRVPRKLMLLPMKKTSSMALLLRAKERRRVAKIIRAKVKMVRRKAVIKKEG